MSRRIKIIKKNNSSDNPDKNINNSSDNPDKNINNSSDNPDKNINKKYITEDDIADWVYNKKGFLITRKYKNIDSVDTNYVCLSGKSNVITFFVKKFLETFKKKFTLILIESDIIKIPKKILEHNLVKKIFTWNKEFQHEKVFCIPIGLNKERHLEVMINTEKNIKKEKLVLINFDKNSHHTRRKIFQNKELLNLSENIEYMKADKIYYNKSYTDYNNSIRIDVTNKNYYKEVSKFKFVVSPRGGGEDCHRTWEALYLGSVPIVLSSSINEIYEDLPVLVINNWNEITEELLNKKWEEFQKKQWKWEKLKIDYWFKIFEENEESEKEEENEESEKINFITYGNDVFSQAKKRLVKEAKNFYNFKSVTSYGPEDLDDEFKNKFQSTLCQPRIGGYGIWRPYIIKKELEKVENNDFLIYCDAGCHLNPKGMKRFQEYLEILKNSNYGIISFQMDDQIEKWWTTKEIFNYFEVEIESEIGNSGQYLDGILIMKKNKHLIKTIDSWMKAVYDKPEMFTDKFNKCNQHSFFKDNRHEQSVFSIIRKIFGSEVIPRDETFHPQPFGCKESLKYPIWATRSKK